MRAIASALGEQRGIPVIDNNIQLIEAVAGEDWWVDVTVPLLELARIRLRELVKLIDSSARTVVYTDFKDTAGESAIVEIRKVAVGVDRARFREKAIAFLREHENDLAISRLRKGLPLARLGGEQVFQRNVFNIVVPNMFAGSILDLEPDTAYEARFVLSDPDGISGPAANAAKTVTVRYASRAATGHRRQGLSRLSDQVARSEITLNRVLHVARHTPVRNPRNARRQAP